MFTERNKFKEKEREDNDDIAQTTEKQRRK